MEVSINGQPRMLPDSAVDPNMPLLWVVGLNGWIKIATDGTRWFSR